jgi:hypothetical protein
VANDRLLAPNNEQTFKELSPSLNSALQVVFPEGKIRITRSSINPKDRLTIRVLTGQSESVDALLGRLSQTRA